MPLPKKAKILSQSQVNVLVGYVGDLRNGQRNQVVVLLSTKAGLRAKEIAALSWKMLITPDGLVSDKISLPNIAAKGESGRVIPLNRKLKRALESLKLAQVSEGSYSADSRVVRTERSPTATPQCIVNMFQGWYSDLGFVGCSSHSGRRTFITNAAKKIALVGGSIRDVQALAGHSSLQTTQRYIEADSAAQSKVVDLI